MSKGMLIDTTKCIGCRACERACKRENIPQTERTDSLASGGGRDKPAGLSSKSLCFVDVKKLEGDNGRANRVYVKKQCMHCEDPACASACLVGALTKTPEGAVVCDHDKCIGCRYCMLACPFNMPKLEWEKTVPRIRKCTMCYGRISSAQSITEANGEPTNARIPACATACPMKAITFGERDDLLADAKRRVANKPDKYIDHVYGEHEAGGTNFVYVSNVPFDRLGFPATSKIGIRGYSAYTKTAKEAVPMVVLGVGALLAGVYWLAGRKQEVEAAQATASEPPPTKYEAIGGSIFTPWMAFLLIVTLSGGVAIAYRMVNGLGATTNLSDQWPWGIWKAVNVVSAIALGAGGFVSAALIYVFGGEKYHRFARSAVLLALLGYGSAGFSLAFDIGIPWRIVHPIWMWPELHSILFEIAWCVMLYCCVLALELLPALFDRFR